MVEFGDRHGPEDRGGFAVVVDPDWRIGVVRGPAGPALPGALLEGDEAPEQALARGLAAWGLTVEIVACLGQARDRGVRVATYWVCRTSTPGTVEWWAPSAALTGLALESERWVTRRALGPC